MRTLIDIRADISSHESDIRIWASTLYLRQEAETKGDDSPSNGAEMRKLQRDIEAAKTTLYQLKDELSEAERAVKKK